MLRNVGSNWVLTGVSIATTYVLTPFIIRRLGGEGYGTWTLITAMTGYLSLMALGVPMACVRFLAQDVSECDARKINVTIGSCAGLYLIIAAVAAMVGLALAVMFRATTEIPEMWRAEAPIAFALMSAWVGASFIGFLPEGILFAHHDFVGRNIIRVAGVLLRCGLTITLLTLRASLIALASVQIACLAFDVTASLLLIRRRYPTVRVALRDFEWATARRVLSFSVYVLLLSAGARLSFETDALVIGAFIGVGSIPFYAVANSLVVYLMDFTVAIGAVVSPMATKLNTEGRVEELRGIFLKWSKVTLSLSVMAGVFLIVLGPRFIGWWIGAEYEQPSGEVLRILVVSCVAFLPVRCVALPILMGLGKPKAATFAFLGAGVANLVLSIGLARPLGLAGVAIGTAIPNVVFAAFVLVVACRELEIPVASYFAYVVPRAMLGSLPLVAVLLWFRFGHDLESLIGFAIAGSLMLLVSAPTWVFFVYRNDRFVDLRPHLMRLRVWARA
jgi:O-antigen/teichoic acid export membrane protein